MEGEEGQPRETPNQEKDEDIDEDLDFEEYSDKTNEFFDSIIKKMGTVAVGVNKIEGALVTNITNDLSIVKALVVEFCSQKYMKAHVRGKVKCIDEEVEDLKKHLNNKKEKKEVDERKLVKTSEWLNSIGKKTEKIKNLVSQFGTLPDEEDEEIGASSLLTGGKREKQKTVSNSPECHKMCIEESLLISPMISGGSLKKSYDHLPQNLKLCFLTLSAFPEDFIIKKRPLIYWWMAEGFVCTSEGENGNSNLKSAEEVGEENFTQLIQLGLIQPWYESGNTNQPHVQGCRVHPWIRRMLVPIAMEARLLEFFGDAQKHPQPGNPRSRRVCLYDEGDGEGVDHTATWKTRNRKYEKLYNDRFRWTIKAQYNRAQLVDKGLLLQKPKDLKEVSERQKKLMMSTKFLTDLNILVAEVSHGKMKHGKDDDDALLAGVNNRLSNLKARIDDAMNNNNNNNNNNKNDVGNNVNEFHDEQMKLQSEIEGLHKQFKVEDQMNYLDRVLDPKVVNDPVVYNRRKNCEILQEQEVLFGHNDVNNPFPNPMKKKKQKNKRTPTSTTSFGTSSNNAVNNDEGAEKLLAVINVTQKYLDMDHEPFGKMKNLRTLHLGRWRDSLPVPHIEVENARILDALFHVAKHLKYLSLRGISRITTLPSTISKCCNLQILDLKACYNLETLPSQIASLYSLTHLDVSECYLLQNTNLWSLVQRLQCLQTLKGLKVDHSTLYSLQALPGSLRKLSIILTTPTFNTHLLPTSLTNLRILTITWRITPDNAQPKPENNPPLQQPEGGEISANKPEKSEEEEEVKGIEEALQNLKKLDLRCYPKKTWPKWVKKHSSLETLYITGGDLEEFPMADLQLPKLQVLRFKYLNKLELDEDNTPQLKSLKFPALISFFNHGIKSKK